MAIETRKRQIGEARVRVCEQTSLCRARCRRLAMTLKDEAVFDEVAQGLTSASH